MEHPPIQNPPSAGEGDKSLKPSTTDTFKDVSEEVLEVKDDYFSGELSPFSTPKVTPKGVVTDDGKTLTPIDEEEEKEGEDEGKSQVMMNLLTVIMIMLPQRKRAHYLRIKKTITKL